MPTILRLYFIRQNDIVLSRVNGHLYGNVLVVQKSNITIRKHTTILINKDKYMFATIMSKLKSKNLARYR